MKVLNIHYDDERYLLWGKCIAGWPEPGANGFDYDQ